MKLILIACVSKNLALGYQNELIYNLPDDMKHFRETTRGHTVIMGSNTYRSLPNGALPKRRNIVLSRKTDGLPGCDVYDSLRRALSTCQEDEEAFIIGGASIYAQAIELADELILTEVDDIPEKADTYFPEFSKDDWELTKRVRHLADDKHPHSFAFAYYKKRTK